MNQKIGLYDTIARFYDKFDSYYEEHIYSKMRAKYLTKITYKTVLEVGVGTGKNLEYFNDSNTKIVGIDISEGMIKQATRKLQSLPLDLQKIISLQKVDRRWDLKHQKFQYVIATFVLCTNDDPTDLIQRIFSILEPSGILILFEWIPTIKGFRGLSLRAINPILHYFFGISAYRKMSLRYFHKDKWELIKKEFFGSENIVLVLQKKSIN